ncbi:MAG: response regulator [Gammaproteobacteria bacterium]
MKPIYKELFEIGVIIVLIIFVVSLSGLLIINRMINPLILITKAYERVSKRNYTPIAVKSPFREINELATGFDHMVRAINDYQQELLKSQEKIKSLASFPHENPQPVLRFSKDGQLMYANPSSESLLKHLFKGDRRTLAKEELNLFCRNDNGEVCEVKHELDDRVFNFVICPVEEEGYVSVYGRDITERQMMQKQLRQSQKMQAIGQLTGGIAHDFNNMLAAIMGYTELARELNAKNGDERMAKYLGEIYRSSARARDLIAQMLAFSRGAKSSGETIYLKPSVTGAIQMIRATLPSSIEIVKRFDSEAGMIVIDPVQLDQVIMNLCINARDAMDGYGRITLSIENVFIESQPCSSCHETIIGEYTELVVQDNGHGIDSNTIEMIFDPFFTRKEVGKGTGMGLSMVHGILHEHHGHIIVESVPEKGSKFRVLFPKATVAEDVVVEHEHLGSQVNIDKLTGKVLIVDDEQAVGNFVRELLESKGCRVVYESDSREALTWFSMNSENVDVVILDQTMPALSGVELAQVMFQKRPDIPIILYSGYTDDINRERARELGIEYFLDKPLNMDLLIRVMATVLSENHALKPAQANSS